MAFGGGNRVSLTKESVEHGCPHQMPRTAYSDKSVEIHEAVMKSEAIIELFSRQNTNKTSGAVLVIIGPGVNMVS